MLIHVAIVPGTQWSKCKHHTSFWQLFSIIFYLWLINLNLWNTLSKVAEMIHWQTEASDCSQTIYSDLNFIYGSALKRSCSSGQIQVQTHSTRSHSCPFFIIFWMDEVVKIQIAANLKDHDILYRLNIWFNCCLPKFKFHFLQLTKKSECNLKECLKYDWILWLIIIL